METMQFRRAVDRPFEEAAELFAGAVSCWLPVIVGPGSGTWRARTDEGPMPVNVIVHASPVFVHPDDVRWRRLRVEPDRSFDRASLTGWLTPGVEGDLGLARTDDGAAELRFEGEPRRRSKVTVWLERVVLGDRLSDSGMDTLLDRIAERLATAQPEDPPGRTSGKVTCDVSPR